MFVQALSTQTTRINKIQIGSDMRGNYIARDLNSQMTKEKVSLSWAGGFSNVVGILNCKFIQKKIGFTLILYVFVKLN